MCVCYRARSVMLHLLCMCLHIVLPVLPAHSMLLVLSIVILSIRCVIAIVFALSCFTCCVCVAGAVCTLDAFVMHAAGVACTLDASCRALCGQECRQVHALPLVLPTCWFSLAGSPLACCACNARKGSLYVHAARGAHDMVRLVHRLVHAGLEVCTGSDLEPRIYSAWGGWRIQNLESRTLGGLCVPCDLCGCVLCNPTSRACQCDS
jgi:hypothetical protein